MPVELESNIRARYAHGRVKRTSSFVVLLDARTASKNLGDVELIDCTLRMGDLSPAADGWCLCPVVGLFGQAWKSIYCPNAPDVPKTA